MDSELTRVCTKCGEEKDLSAFGKRNERLHYNQCKLCQAAASNARYYAKREEILAKMKVYGEGRKEARRAYYKEWREKNADYKKAQDRAYYAKNAERIKKYCNAYYHENKEAVSLVTKAYRKNNKEACCERSRKYRATRGKQRYEYDKARMQTDIEYKLQCVLRSRLRDAIRGNSKSGSAVRDLGCSIAKLKKRLESMFYPHSKTGEKMCWVNHGLYGWHIDHIKPLSSFDLTDREQLLEACHYTNLQPLWAVDNLEKGAKVA